MRIFVYLLLVALATATFAEEPSPTPVPVTWAEMLAQGLSPYHQLTLTDFSINDTVFPKDAFHIRPGIEPRYHYYIKFYNGFYFAFVDQWIVFSGFWKTATTRKSKFKEMEAALPYAQALLDLNEICARRLAGLKAGELPQARGDDEAKAKAEMERKLREFVDAKYKDLHDEMDKLASETDYGRNAKKTRALAAEIRKRLDAIPNTTVPFRLPDF
jgi:hypothetical protein